MDIFNVKKPEITDMVHFVGNIDGDNDGKALGAVITQVHNDHWVNLTVFLPSGHTKPETMVRLYPDVDDNGDPVVYPTAGTYARWPAGQPHKFHVPGVVPDQVRDMLVRHFEKDSPES